MTETPISVTEEVVVVTVDPVGVQGPRGPQGVRGPVGTQPVFSRAGMLFEQESPSRFYIDQAATITKVRISVGTPPVGGFVVVDVNKNGTSVFTNQNNRPKIAAGEHTDAAIPDITSLVPGDYLTVDIDSVGTTDPGADLTVSVTLA